MILADTSVWIDHLRRGNSDLRRRLEDGDIGCHDFVAGELACGTLHRRHEILGLLTTLPPAGVASHAEVLHLVQSRSLMGRGLGWIDMHLLASCVVTPAALWTLDRRLADAARQLGVA